MKWNRREWDCTTYKKFQLYLVQIAQEKYREFSEKIIPSAGVPILGIRLPQLHKLAKEIVQGNWESYLKFAQDDSHEEILLQGLVIAKADLQTDFPTLWRRVIDYVPKLVNWAQVDTFCSAFKIVDRHKETAFPLIVLCLESFGEFKVRFAVVMLLEYYLEPSYIQEIFVQLDSISHSGYYVKMAVAWAISVAFIVLPEETTAYLHHNQLDEWTYRKALQKIVESNRVDKETKDMIRGWKRKI